MAAAGVFGLGGLALAGRLFDLTTPEILISGRAGMNSSAALAFMLCAISLWFSKDGDRTAVERVLANACAAMVLLFAALTLGEYLSGRDLGVEQFLFRDVTQASEISPPGRMPPNTALNFLLSGTALIVLGRRWKNWISESLAIVALLISGIALIGHVYGVSSLNRIGAYSSMALPASLGFILLCVGILAARPKHGAIRILSDNGPAGILVRRLLPAAIGIPTVLGWLFLRGERAGYYDTALALALLALANVLIFSVMIWRIARSLERVQAELGQAERTLSLSEQRSQALIENSWDAIALFDAEGTILYGSPSTPQILGYSLDEFVGQNAFELIHAEDSGLVAERLKLSLTRPGEHIRMQARVRHKDGKWRWLEGVFTNLLEEASVQAIVTNYHDFSERQEAQAALQRLNDELEKQVRDRTAALSKSNSLLQMLLDHTPDHIFFKDAHSRFIRNSRSQARALGLGDPSEAVGRSEVDFLPNAQQSHEMEQEIMRSGRPVVDLEERIAWPDGTETWVSTTKVPLPDQTGRIVGTFGISRDITERKRAEASLERAKMELEAANKELEAFSYSVSHDLRAPLRSVDGFSQALLEDYGELLPTEGRMFLERIRGSAQRMAELIDDLLNLSKLTRASMRAKSLDMSQLAQVIVGELQVADRLRRANVKIAPNLRAYGDPNLLRVALENLLNNAWKYTSRREQTEIEFGANYENDETVFFVRDNGAGFDMAYARKLFGAFQRLHASTEFPGTGIGLATVQRIIHRHGGRVWAEGAVDRGAIFFFTLPSLEGRRRSERPKQKDSLARRVREII